MALHITKPGERVPVNAVNLLIYGQPSTGKTSLCYTMRNPLVIDFDGGAHRSQQSPLGTTVRVDSWADVEELFSSNMVRDYDTIVIDTVGSALDYLAAFIIQQNPKMGTLKGTLTITGWGELKAVFSAWFRRLNVMGKTVVMIAHHKEEKEGDATRKRPDIQGSSYGLVMKQADYVGFAHLNEAGKRVIGFAPTADYFGKDSARLGVVAVDDLDTNPEYGAGLITTMREAFAARMEAHENALKISNEVYNAIFAAQTPEELTELVTVIKQLPEAIAVPTKERLKDKAKERGYKWVAKNNRYEVA